MSKQTIRRRDIEKALREKHGGVLRAVGRNNILVQLLNSMSLPSGRQQFLREELERMTAIGAIVVETNGTFYDLIALPGVNLTPEITEEGEEEMPERRGQHRTCQPTDGRGRQLPARLRDSDVSEVQVTYANPQLAELVEPVVSLVTEELVKIGKERLGREEVVAVIEMVVKSLYEGNESVTLLRDPVFGALVDSKRLRRVELGKPPRRGQRPQAVVYDFTLPKPEPLSKDEAIARLMQRVEDQDELLTAKDKALGEKDETIAQLTAENEVLTEKSKSVISEETLAELVTNLETANETIGRLRGELEEAATAKETTDRTHAAAIRKLKGDHGRELGRVNTRLAEAIAAKEAAEEELRKHQSNGQVDPALAARLAKVLANK